MNRSEIRLGRQFLWNAKDTRPKQVVALMNSHIRFLVEDNKLELDHFLDPFEDVLWLDTQSAAVAPTSAGPGKCRHCDLINEYQSGPYTCSSCRLWGRA